MNEKRHSGIFQAFWPMKVEAKSAKLVINIAFEATSKKMCKALSWNPGEMGQSVNTNGGKNAIAVCIFHASVKTKEVKRDWFLPRLVEDIERKTFCVYIVQMLILCFVFRWLRSKKIDLKMHLRESRTPLGSKPLWAFGKYTRLLLLSTHLCKNLLKPLSIS